MKNILSVSRLWQIIYEHCLRTYGQKNTMVTFIVINGKKCTVHSNSYAIFIKCNESTLFLDPGLWLHRGSAKEQLLVNPAVQPGVHHQGLQDKHEPGESR